MLRILCLAAVLGCMTMQTGAATHYEPEGRSAVCVNGSARYNRALYGAHSGFRMECSDTPVFGIYLPTMGGHLEFSLPEGDCRAVYTPGRMDYTQGGVEIEAQVLRSTDAALWRITNTTGRTVDVPVTFGGVSGRKFYREGDLGVDAPDCFDLKPEYCDGNILSIKGDRLSVEYGKKERKTVCLVIPASKSVITSDNIYKGEITLRPGKSCIVAYFPSDKHSDESLDLLMARAERERAELASSLEISTPDPWLNPVGGALAVAADGIWSGNAWLHGSIGWRTPHLGWRGAYCGDALGWHDRALTHFDTYADNQITDIPASLTHPRQDKSQNMARAEKKWGTPMYSNGYICRRPGKKTEMSHYDMNMVYADAMLRHFMHTGDTVSMRRLFPVLKRHLSWEKLNFDPDGDHLYDAYCCIWASDALYYSGGAVTHSSAYNYFANLMAARVARAIGEDAAPYEAEAAAIYAAIDSTLWMSDKGCWAEYRDLGGHERLHPYPAVWTVYHAIDSRVGDEFKRYAATRYVDREIPRLPVNGSDSLYTISTTNWKPYSWSINNVAIAEVMHTALAYWQAGRPDDAYRLMKGVVIDNMYTGASPLNFGQISSYDAARGECYRDFADPIGVWSRAVTEGLYGLSPDMLARQRSLSIRPGFPSSWAHASFAMADVAYSFSREGDVDTYIIEPRNYADAKVTLTVPALGLSGVTVNGNPARWEVTENSIGEPRVTVTLPVGSDKKSVRIHRSASRTAVPTGAVRREGPVCFTEMASGLLRWWQPADNGLASADNSAISQAIARTGDFEAVEPAKCEPLDLTSLYNASVSDIFGNEYLSPRPEVTTLQIPVQGIGEWCHPKLTAVVDDYNLRQLSQQGNGRVNLLDIPFAMPAEGHNVLFTTLWDNYPTSAVIPLNGNASHLYMLMAGSTNHMQWGMENARLTVRYADGSSDTVPLVNPVNWAPIEQDFYTDRYAFAQPAGASLPYRVHLRSGEVSRNLGEKLHLKGPYDRNIPGGAGILLDIHVDPAKTLDRLEFETISHDVVAGIMSVSLQRP